MPYKSIKKRREAVRKSLEKHKIKYRKIHNAWRKGNKAYLEKRKKYYRKNKKKMLARSIVNNAIKIGKLLRGKCKVCHSPNAHAHHRDYSKPLQIIWLCRKHHLKLHNGKATL